MMRKRYILIGLLAILLAFQASEATLTLNPNKILRDFTQNGEQPHSQTLIYTNDDPNTTIDVVLDITGNIAPFVFLNNSAFTLSGIDTEQVLVEFNIPPTTQPGLYLGDIYSDTTDLPVFLEVKSGSSPEDCRILTTFPEYAVTLKKGVNSYQQAYSFTISKNCVGGLDVTDIFVSGQVVQTDNGFQPIKLAGGIPTGFKDSGDTFQVTLDFDSSELTTGTYIAYLVVGGNWNSETVSSTIKFSVTVTGEASPVAGTTLKEPTWQIPTNMVINQTYEVIANSVDANINPNLQPEFFYEGKGIEITDTTVKYTIIPLEIGNFKVKYWAEYNGLLIGKVHEQDIRVTKAGSPDAGVNLAYKFYPSDLSKLVNNEKLTILLIDNKTDNVVDGFKLYINGQLVDNSTITVHAGETYSLIGTATGYLDAPEHTFSINTTPIEIFLNPESPVVGDLVNITTNPANATIHINGLRVSGIWEPKAVGEHEINASLQGYEDSSLRIMIDDSISLVSLPAGLEDKNENGYLELKKGKEYTIKFNKEVSAEVKYQSDEESDWESRVSITSEEVQFTPTEAGFYSINANGQAVKVYEVRASLSVYMVAGIISAIIIIGFLAFAYYFGSKESSPAKSPAKFEFDLTQPQKQ